MGARRHLPAAVLREGDPGAEHAARLVPDNAVVVTVGRAIAGYWAGKRSARRPLTADQFQAVARIHDVSRLLAWRADAGEAPSEHSIEAALDILVDAARHLPSGRYSLGHVRDHLPEGWRSMASDSQVLRAITTPRPPRDGIVSNRAAGRTLGVRLVEVIDIEAEDGGRPFPLVAIDEPEEARALRRATRRRQMEAARKRRARAAKRDAEGCRPGVRISYYRKGDADAPATLQADTVRAAVEGGAASVKEIVAAAGLPVSTIKPILSRLAKAGSIVRTARGRYAACTPKPLPGVGAGLNAEAALTSGPKIPPDPTEPPSEAARNAPASAPVGSTGRAPDARGTACGAGPEVGPVRPAFSAAPTPGSGASDGAPKTAGACRPRPPFAPVHPHRRTAFSRLPGLLFAPLNRSYANAASPPRCA